MNPDAPPPTHAADTTDAGRARAPVARRVACPPVGARAIVDGLRRRRFVAFFAPVIDPGDGRVLRLDATVRWAHPRWGLLGPADFLCEADQHGLLAPLAMQFVDSAAAAVAAWRTQAPAVDAGLRAPVRVSLSGARLRSAAGALALGRMLARRGLDRFTLAGAGTPPDAVALGDCADTRAALGARLAAHTARAATAHGLAVAGVDTLLKWYLARDFGAASVQGTFICAPMASHQIGAGLRQWQGHYRAMTASDA